MTAIAANALLIVIPCLNEEDHLDRLVRELVGQTTGLSARIVIADGGSTDKTLVIANELATAFPNVTLLHNPKRIQSAAVNLAVETFGNDANVLIRIDAHADYPDDYCATLLREQTATNADSVVVAMETVGLAGFQKAVALAQNSKLGNGGSAHRSRGGDGQWVDHGHHALMRVAAFRAVGGYDENFSHNEDAELDLRLRQAGFKIWLTGQTALTYYPRSTPDALFRQYFKFGAGRARTLVKHRSLPKLRQLAPTAVAPSAALAILAPLCGLAIVPFALWAGLCLGYGAKLAYNSGDKDWAAPGVAAMIMHFAWSLGFWRGFATAIFQILRKD